jgi:hypothetical protein
MFVLTPACFVSFRVSIATCRKIEEGIREKCVTLCEEMRDFFL